MELRILLNILYRRRVIFFLVSCFFLLLVGCITLLAPESYKATAKIIVEKTDKINAVMVGLGLQGIVLDTQVDDDVSLDTDIELLMIRPLVDQLIADMNLRDSDGEYLQTDDFIDGGFTSKLKGEPAVDIEQYNDTALVSIEADAPTPKQAAEIANRLARMYVEERIARTKADFGEVKSSIDQSLGRIRDDYYKRLQDYKEFKQETGMVDIDGTVTNLIEQIVELENSRADYQRNIASFAETVEISRQQLEKTEKMWQSGEEMSQSSAVTELRQKLIGLSAQLASLGVTVTEQHPDYKSLAAQADKVTALLKNEPELSTSRQQFTLNPVYELLYKNITDNMINLKGMIAKLETIDKQITEFKERLLRLPAMQMDNSKLSSEVASASELYATVLQHSLKIGLAESSAVAKIRLVEPAKEPKAGKPNFPNKAVNLILGILFGCFFGICAALTADYADGSVHEAEALRRQNGGQHYFGALPYSSGLTWRPTAIFHASVAVNEGLRSIRDALISAVGGSGGGLFVVTSAAERSGASTVAAGLAMMLAELHEDVLLVDLNLRQPALSRLLARSDSATGTAELLSAGNETIQDITPLPSPVHGLFILPVGKLSKNPGRLLNSRLLAPLFAELRKRFRYVIVDSPSAALYHDAVILAGKADAAVLVVRAAADSAPAAADCIDRLRIADGCLIGTVLNCDGYSPALHRLPWMAVKFIPEMLRNWTRKRRML
jgi:tyrosine-protein kinase Etk/Wzc